MQSVFTNNFGKIAAWMEETRLSLHSSSRSPRDWLTPAPLEPPASSAVWLWRPLANIQTPSSRDDKMAYILTRQRLMKPFRVIYWNTSKDLALQAPPSMSRCKKSNICLISAPISNYFLEAFFSCYPLSLRLCLSFTLRVTKGSQLKSMNALHAQFKQAAFILFFYLFFYTKWK